MLFKDIKSGKFKARLLALDLYCLIHFSKDTVDLLTIALQSNISQRLSVMSWCLQLRQLSHAFLVILNSALIH